MSKKEEKILYDDIKKSAVRGDRLQALRLEKGFTRLQAWNEIFDGDKEGSQKDGADHGKTVYMWETGGNTPKVSDLVKIANYYGCDVSYLLNDSRQGIDTRTHANADVCKELGISENTVREIRKLDEPLKDILDRLSFFRECGWSYLRFLLFDVMDYSLHTPALEKLEYTNGAGDKDVANWREIEAFKKFKISDDIFRMLDLVRSSYKKMRDAFVDLEIQKIKKNISDTDERIERRDQLRKWKEQKAEWEREGLTNGNSNEKR